ncbi:hypothetical protein bcgnr5372_37340 [Bacillus luti]|nr:hypothetical protein [Bacillus cereus]HDR8330040.1 hypothetical protein [Bacillus cereus]HDR8337262.1 hypothetical protein [Bacillus cereus]
MQYVTNKHILQKICGALLLLSFFSSWYNTGALLIQPSELMGYIRFPIFKLFFVLPILGIAHIYFGWMKTYKPILHLVSTIISIILMYELHEVVDFSTSDRDGAANGYYMAGLAIIVSIASFVLSKKEVPNTYTSSKEG